MKFKVNGLTLITKQEQEGTASLHTDVLAALHKHQGWRVSEPGFPCTFPAFLICKMGTKGPFWSLLSTKEEAVLCPMPSPTWGCLHEGVCVRGPSAWGGLLSAPHTSGGPHGGHWDAFGDPQGWKGSGDAAPLTGGEPGNAEDVRHRLLLLLLLLVPRPLPSCQPAPRRHRPRLHRPGQARPRLHGPGLTVRKGVGGEEGGTRPRLLGAGNMAGAGPCPRPAGRA